jgi:hypothetical protein
MLRDGKIIFEGPDEVLRRSQDEYIKTFSCVEGLLQGKPESIDRPRTPNSGINIPGGSSGTRIGNWTNPASQSPKFRSIHIGQTRAKYGNDSRQAVKLFH